MGWFSTPEQIRDDLAADRANPPDPHDPAGYPGFLDEAWASIPRGIHAGMTAAQAAVNRGLGSVLLPLAEQADVTFGTGFAGGLEDAIGRSSQVATEANQFGATTMGTGSQVIKGVAKGLTEAAPALLAGPAAPAVAFGSVGASEGVGTYDEMVARGVDDSTARLAGIATGALSGLGTLMPVTWGLRGVVPNLAASAVANAGLGAAGRYANSTILADAGYQGMAEQYRVWDGEALATDAILGAAFTGYHQWRAGRVEPSPAAVDDALAIREARHADTDTAPGLPATPEAMAAHLDALAEIERAVVEGRPPNFDGTGIYDAGFVRDPAREAWRAEMAALLEKEIEPAPLPEENAPSALSHAEAGRQIADDVRDQLVAAGRSPEEAEAGGALWGAFFHTFIGERGGFDPLKTYQDWGLEIRRGERGEDDAAEQRFNQPINEGVNLDREMPVVEVPRVAVENNAAERKAAKEARKGQAGVDLENPDLPGARVHLSGGDWVHAISSWKKSVDATGEDGAALAHLDATRVLPELFRKSALVESHDHEGRSQFVGKVHRFFAAMQQDDAVYAVKMTVQHLPDGSRQLVVDGVERLDKLHDMHLAKKIPAEGVLGETPDTGALFPPSLQKPSLESTGSGRTGNTVILRDLIRGIKGEDDKAYLQAAPTGGGSRASVSFVDGQPLVRLFETADESSFAHESAHIWLEMARAAGEGGRPEAKTVWDDIRAALGIGEGEAITRDQHEAFAEGFEAYLRDGNAPSPALAGVFARFKAWLRALYQNLTDRGGPVPEGLRSVYDRMLASDAEIATARGTNRSGGSDGISAAEPLEVLAAQQALAERPDLTIGVGDDGAASAREVLARHDAEIAQATELSRLIETAAACALRA